MMQSLLLALAGLVALGVGGEWLVRGSTGIALRMGISSLVTGIVIVGFATSMPEMVASVQAALLGSPEIAWGNIAGSNLANTLMILGAAALVAPIALTGKGRRDAAVALAVSVLILVLAATGIAGPVVAGAMLIGIAVYVVWRYGASRREGVDELEEIPDVLPSWAKAGFFFLLGLGTLIVGGQVLVTSAIDLAQRFGVSETVIGLTVVAIGTSLPELAASLVAAFRGQSGLALGNVLGSNIYNILLIGGTTMLIAPGAIPAELAVKELPLVAGSALAVLLMCWFARSIPRWLGAVMVAAFAANIVLLFGS